MKFRIIYSSFALLLATFLFLSNSNGPAAGGAGARTGAPSEGLCSNCHGGGSFNAAISIQMLDGANPITSYTPGQAYTLRVQMSGGGGCYGAQTTILRNSNNTTAGTLSAPNTGSSIRSLNSRSYLEHNTRSSSGTFTATWTAPAAGTGAVTIYSAGIVCNGINTSNDNTANGSLVLSEAATPSATVTYASASYCQNGTDPTPTITGTQGGTFSSTSGLSINTSSGAIDLSASTPNAYTVTYTFAGGSSTSSVTVVAADQATITYPNTNICQYDAGPQMPIITGAQGGSFALNTGVPATPINPSTGAFTVNGAIAGSYPIFYTTNGACPTTAFTMINIQPSPNASFIYSANSVCQNATTFSPESIITNGGSFSAASGLNIASSTGIINPSASTLGTYDVRYTLTNGTCTNTDTVQITITGAPSAEFNYPTALLCRSQPNIQPNIIGNGGGTFSATPAGLSLNTNTGQIAAASSQSNTYQIIYNITGACAAADTALLQVADRDIATFAYPDSLYCQPSPNAIPTVNSNANGYFFADPSGLTFVDSITGEIDLNSSLLGFYTVSYVTQGICPDTFTQYLNYGICGGALPSQSPKITVSPNPTSGRLLIDIQNLSSDEPIQIRLIDAQGRLIMQSQTTAVSQNLDFSAFPQGLYWLSVQSAQHIFSQAIRIE